MSKASLTHDDSALDRNHGQPEAPDTTDRLLKAVQRLERIAEANNDEFRYRIELCPRRNGLEFDFRCTEMADGHDFLNVSHYDIGELPGLIEADIQDSCDAWNYKVVE